MRLLRTLFVLIWWSGKNDGTVLTVQKNFSFCIVLSGGTRDLSDLLSSTLPVRHPAVRKMDDVQVPEKGGSECFVCCLEIECRK